MCRDKRVSIFIAYIILLSFVSKGIHAFEPEFGSTRVVFQTNYGDIEFGFYPSVAPKTVEHIFKLVRLGGYNTNHFFRVDKGFVAQVADVAGGRSAPMNEEQRAVAEKNVVGEFSEVKHVRGILSMGRHADPDSGSSSFSMLLGDAPHLDGTYAIFGKVTKGDETLRKLEQLPTRREGIFVMRYNGRGCCVAGGSCTGRIRIGLGIVIVRSCPGRAGEGRGGDEEEEWMLGRASSLATAGSYQGMQQRRVMMEVEGWDTVGCWRMVVLDLSPFLPLVQLLEICMPGIWSSGWGVHVPTL
ncbi:hypothetical protein KY290_000555 [Solanum tuberosum]|uniref:Peptidyl-prolyl cis-trans isomerase n=1 Tax=Solanum tuberosum TaxID=4113 RepID=A0ABQ7WJN0_SOLTU|nr:hypothetical protein KY290_000555 [Solanum tuberosum]